MHEGGRGVGDCAEWAWLAVFGCVKGVKGVKPRAVCKLCVVGGALV